MLADLKAASLVDSLAGQMVCWMVDQWAASRAGLWVVQREPLLVDLWADPKVVQLVGLRVSPRADPLVGQTVGHLAGYSAGRKVDLWVVLTVDPRDGLRVDLSAGHWAD